MRRCSLLLLFLMLTATAWAQEKPAVKTAPPVEISAEDREVLKLMELLEILQLLQELEVVANMEDEQ